MQMPSGRLTIDWMLEALSAEGVLGNAQARRARTRLSATTSERHPLNRLGDMALPREDRPGQSLDTEALLQWLADAVSLPYRRLDPLKIDVAAVTRIIPYAYAARLGILPIAVDTHRAEFAISEPGLTDWQTELASSSGRRIDVALANPADIERYRVEFYALARSIKAGQYKAGSEAGIGNAEHLTQLGRPGQTGASEQHIIGIVDWLLQFAYEQRASDIHLEPRREAGHVRFRIDGILHPVYQMPPNIMTESCSRLKILARLDVAEKRRPQDGRIKTRSPDGQEIELRLSTMPTAFGEKLVLRIFDPDTLVKDDRALGLSARQSAQWREMTRLGHGIVLVTGPTGSGKTTTLYSTLKQLASPQRNICTVEDPIELVEPSFNQMQINRTLELGFAEGIRTMLRQDPDIIMVGETRDLPTANSAIQAALTGHLVLTTLHTNDAPSAVTRLLDLGVPAYLIRATVIGVMAQRLVRRLCPHCKQPARLSADQCVDLGITAPDAAEVFGPQGCLECRNSGYLGRVGLYELLTINDAMRHHIADGADEQGLRQHVRQQGVSSLREAGIASLQAGQTSLEEVLRVTPPG